MRILSSITAHLVTVIMLAAPVTGLAQDTITEETLNDIIDEIIETVEEKDLTYLDMFLSRDMVIRIKDFQGNDVQTMNREEYLQSIRDSWNSGTAYETEYGDREFTIVDPKNGSSVIMVTSTYKQEDKEITDRYIQETVFKVINDEITITEAIFSPQPL